jgi:hypothetical protein
MMQIAKRRAPSREILRPLIAPPAMRFATRTLDVQSDGKPAIAADRANQILALLVTIVMGHATERGVRRRGKPIT